jgi:hypothetical protein
VRPFRLTEDDFIAASNLAAGALSRQLRAVIALVIAILVVFAIDYYPEISFPFGVPILVVLAFALLISHPRSRRRRLRKVFNEQKSLHTEVALSFNEDGLRGKGERGSFYIPWDEVSRYREDNRCILVYESAGLARIIPKRCFDSEDELGVFLDKLHRARK